MAPIKWIKQKVGGWLVPLGAKHGMWARLYYSFASGEFVREQKAFLAGRKIYQKNLECPSGSLATLRRNIHRLEKGLIMRPRRIPFALGFIEETVNAFVVASNNSIDSNELAWATDVLAEYFRVHANVKAVARFCSQFLSCSPVESVSGMERVPYCRDSSAAPAIRFDELWRLARYRRSVRWFLKKTVPRDVIDRAVELAAQAPSACNRQPFEFRVFDEAALVQKVVNIPYGLSGYGHNVPVVIVVVGQQRNYFHERDRHLIYIDASLAVMGLLFALEVQGVSSCCVNWPDIAHKEKSMAELIGLSDDERPVMLVALGYPDPDGQVPNSTKKSLSVLRRYNLE